VGHDALVRIECSADRSARTQAMGSVMGRTWKAQRLERQNEKDKRGFGKHLPWVPDDLPAVAANYWPRKEEWPTAADVRRFIEVTEGKPDARLAVLTGLRRWAEPASSQMLLTVAAIIVSIVAVALAVSDFYMLFYVGMVGAGVAYIVVALIAISLALRMDKRRKMAHGWLRAIEDGLSTGGAPARKLTLFSLRETLRIHNSLGRESDR
jgi:uncharacterized membrane protein